MKQHAQIAHQMPGRIRIKIPAAKGNPELLEQVRQIFAGIPGLERTRIKPDAGSIVLRYDPKDEAMFQERLMRHWKHALPLIPHKAPKKPELPGNEFAQVAHSVETEAAFLAGHSRSARAIVDFFREADREIKLLTNNAIDLKIVLALGLAVATFAGIGATAATPMWVTLALFALNHFLEMHTPGAAAAASMPHQAIGAVAR
jgi:Heavy metal associated domain 2